MFEQWASLAVPGIIIPGNYESQDRLRVPPELPDWTASLLWSLLGVSCRTARKTLVNPLARIVEEGHDGVT